MGEQRPVLPVKAPIKGFRFKHRVKRAAAGPFSMVEGCRLGSIAHLRAAEKVMRSE